MTLEFIAATIADIAALWKLAAVIALAVVLLVYRTPIAGVLERGGLRVRRRDTEFELPPAPRKADRDAGEKPEEPRAEGEEDALPARVTKASLAGEDDEGTAGDDREEPSLGSVLALLLRGDVERARSLFDEVQRSEQDEITRLRNQASFAAARAAKTDDPVALEELVAVAERDEVAAYARNLLGVVHMETGYPEKAVEAYESALTAASDDDDIARAAEGVARALAALGSEREGIERLEWSLGRITSARAATAVYRAIADLQQERKDWIRRSIALSKAVELSERHSFEICACI